MPKPLKRHESLQPVSREHHHGLLLSWKIRQGLKKKISFGRIKKYVDWFWKNHLQSHFAFEEQYIFPILGEENNSVKRALLEHDRLKRLFATNDQLKENLPLLQEALVVHIRFEERVLFEEVEYISTKEQLNRIKEMHSKKHYEEWHDEFWISKVI